jgi:hypothetical protein
MDAAYKQCAVPPELEISYLLGKIGEEARKCWDHKENIGTTIHS